MLTASGFIEQRLAVAYGSWIVGDVYCSSWSLMHSLSSTLRCLIECIHLTVLGGVNALGSQSC